jgi:hypothetical protein
MGDGGGRGRGRGDDDVVEVGGGEMGRTPSSEGSRLVTAATRVEESALSKGR